MLYVTRPTINQYIQNGAREYVCVGVYVSLE